MSLKKKPTLVPSTKWDSSEPLAFAHHGLLHRGAVVAALEGALAEELGVGSHRNGWWGMLSRCGDPTSTRTSARRGEWAEGN